MLGLVPFRLVFPQIDRRALKLSWDPGEARYDMIRGEPGLGAARAATSAGLAFCGV